MKTENSEQKAVVGCQLTVEQLKNYLGTGLQLDVEGEIRSFYGLYQSNSITRVETENSYMELSENKPICYRLSDLDKFIPKLGFVPLIELARIDSGLKDVDFGIDDEGNCIGRLNSGVVVVFEITDEVPFVKEIHNNIFGQISGDEWDDMYMASINPSQIREKLFQWHFWPFGEEYFEDGLVIDKLKQGKEVSNG